MLKLKELEQKAKNRGIKGYKNISINKLLSALSTSDLVKENEKNSKDTDSVKNEDYDAD